MGDLLRQGIQWLQQQRTAHCSSQVTYRREATELLVNATFGRTEYEVEDETSGGGSGGGFGGSSGGGLRVGAQVTDFLILAEAFAPTFGEPQAGDQIVADGVVYEVMAWGGDFRGWRWSDPYRTTMRIHTKDIGADA